MPTLSKRFFRKPTLLENSSKLDHIKNTYVDTSKPKKGVEPGDVGDVPQPEEVKTSDGKKQFKQKKKISEKAILQIIKADPTSVVDENAQSLDAVKKVGGYTEWIVRQYFKLIPTDFTGKKDARFDDIKDGVQRFGEDLYKVTEDLIKYKRFKDRLPTDKRDINRVQSTDELYDIVKDIAVEDVTSTKAEIKLRTLKQDAELVFEDAHYEIIIPKSTEASCILAGPPLTRWCTAGSQANIYHNSYSKNGPLYIIRDKTKIVPSGRGAGEPKPIYQFHFPSGQYMDVDDRQIDVVKYLNTSGNEGIKNYFKPAFEQAFNTKDFNVDDRTFQMYIELYGGNEETTSLILRLLKIKVESSTDIWVADDSKEYQGYVKMLKYELFVEKLFEYMLPSVEILEITFKDYKGNGIDIPERICDLTEIKNIVFSGFLKSLPKNIGNLKKLDLMALSKNLNLKELPESLGTIKNMQVLNIIDSPKLKELPKSVQKRQMDVDDVMLVVFN